MKKILIPNGSFHDIPLIRTAKEMGYYVITSGAAANGIGHQYADEYVYGDFSDKELMLQIAREKEIDAVCSNCNDFGYLSACYVAEELGLGGHESFANAVTLHHKDAFKKFAARFDLSTPKAESFGDVDTALAWCAVQPFPLIVKPTDLGAGQGIKRVDDMDAARIAIEDALSKSKAKHIVIEPFIEGTAHSFNAFIVDQKVAGYYSDNEYMLYTPYRVSTSAGPADGIEQALPVLIHDTELVARELDLPDGLVHSQYIRDKEGKPHILEITRRMSGDWYPYPEMEATGINWMEYIVKAQCSIDCSDFPKDKKQRGYTGRHCLNALRTGRIKKISLDEQYLKPYVYDSVIWANENFDIERQDKDYPGILFLRFPDRATQMKTIAHIKEYVAFKFEK